jgi:surfeit locus 1 family protein
MKRLPVIPTVIVALAVALMIKLGFWQLERRHEKEALIARYAAALNLPAIAYPAIAMGDQYLFRKAGGMCLEPVSETILPGSNRKAVRGWSHIIACRTGAEGPGMMVDLGWSQGFDKKSGWKGGMVSGVIGSQPDHRSVVERALGKGTKPGLILVADAAIAGLEPSATPSLAEVPNNHLAYAVQWFLFAAIASIIYALALWRRSR